MPAAIPGNRSAMTLSDQSKAYLQQLAQQGYASGTVAYHNTYLKQFLTFLGITELTKETILSFQLHVFKAKGSTAGKRHKLTTVNHFLKYLYQNQQTLSDLSQVIKPPKETGRFIPQVLSESEIKTLLRQPDTKNPVGLRDRAILELFYSSGLRRSELTALKLYDLNAADPSLKVRGKGLKRSGGAAKERTVPVGLKAMDWIKKYLEIRPHYLINPREQSLFISMNSGRPLAPVWINQMVREYAKSSGINKRITPHILRHTCATHLLKNGADIRYIQQLLGHTHVDTTRIYTHVEISELDKLIEHFHPRG